MADSAAVPMISIEGVNKHFGALHVLKDINLDIDRGQVVVVLGPSGSGKSTLCRTINRLETTDSGTISIDGERLPVEGRKLAQLRSDVGMVFQSFNIFAHKTILDNVDDEDDDSDYDKDGEDGEDDDDDEELSFLRTDSTLGGFFFAL